MNLLQALHHRRSVPSRLLTEPGPSESQLMQMLECAVRVPDHGKLVPWRFVKIAGPARHRLGEILASRSLELRPGAALAALEKDRQRFSHAPVIITVVARVTPDHKVPVQEQLSSGAAVCLTLLQAADALGFAAQWLTGWAAYDPVIVRELGLKENESVLGFIHIGSAHEPVPERDRPQAAELLSEWRP